MLAGHTRRRLIVVVVVVVVSVSSPPGTPSRQRAPLLNSPAGNVLGVLAHAGALGVADLEDGADGAAVLAGHALHADVVLAAVLGVGVAGEGAAGAGDLTGSGAGEAVGDLCETGGLLVHGRARAGGRLRSAG